MAICECPNCKKKHKVPDDLLGTRGRCSGCRSAFELRSVTSAGDSKIARVNIDQDEEEVPEQVAPLPSRIGLRSVSVLLLFAGFVGAATSVLLICASLVDASRNDASSSGLGISPLFFGSLFGSMGLIWSGGMLQLGMAIESRIHENTEFLSAFRACFEKK